LNSRETGAVCLYDAARLCAGDHFGTLTTLASGDRKRPFTGATTVACELAVISRVGYNRVLKKNLQYAIDRRVALFQELSVMKSSSVTALQKVATYCQDEMYPAGRPYLVPVSLEAKGWRHRVPLLILDGNRHLLSRLTVCICTPYTVRTTTGHYIKQRHTYICTTTHAYNHWWSGTLGYTNWMACESEGIPVTGATEAPSRWSACGVLAHWRL
jgi:hypothetical protein